MAEDENWSIYVDLATLATRNSQTCKCVVFAYNRYILFWDTSFHFIVFIKISNCVPLYLKIKYNLHISNLWITVYPSGEHEFTIFCTRHQIIKQSLLVFLSYYWPLYGLSFFNLMFLITPLISSNFLTNAIFKAQIIQGFMHCSFIV